MITNWDHLETILDYSFVHLGVSSSGYVDNPIIMNEVMAPPFQQRSNLMQLLFETYAVPKLTFGVDSLFSYYYNGGSNGLVIGTGHDATHVIPVVDHRPIVSISKRLNWGGNQSFNYLSSALALKYPYFPARISSYNVENMVKDFCYVSKDFNEEIKYYLDLDNLEKKDIVIEAPFTEFIKPVKTEEELALEAEKKKETLRKLQEQAQQRRLEKLVQKEQDHVYYAALKEKLAKMNKKQFLETLRAEGFEDEADLNKYMGSLERSLARARKQDIGENDTDNGPPSWPLVDIPDAELDEEQIKEKRKQRLMKSNYDARQRAKEEKELAKKQAEEEARKDKEWRESDLEGWSADRRSKLEKLIKRRKDRKKLKEELTDRKSRAAQMRMKNIASLASDDGPAVSGSSARKRKAAASVTIDDDPNDTFGANDDDWAVYRDIANVDDEEAEEEEEQMILNIESELLEFDPTFTVEDTLERQFNWRNSIIHRFLRGPRDYQEDDQHQNHQIHLNVERIRIPEILFQPSIAGVDQAGISELCEDTVLRRLPQESGFSGDDSKRILKDIFLTGGQSLFQNFEERLNNEFRSFLPVGTELKIRRAIDPLLDAWKGMAKWANTSDSKGSYITKKEYEEMGPEYIKENNFGCVKL
ncbi:unnamed protein product [Ambrosiozyma monospora]|uniref:Unnamed protein product n=1 Tax=Ambrosiozyma monospora TaxID=43982 RepID=A0ACB5SSZ0_AMBMO|nr:unnamed protein product [Ambrosiozyma monospora]